MKTYCDKTGKEQFHTKAEAERAVRSMRRSHKNVGAVYFCPECHTWHITSISYQRSKAKRSREKRGGLTKYNNLTEA